MRLLLKQAAAVVVTVLFLAVLNARAEDAGALYKTKCQACHGPDGKGDTPAGKKLGARDFHAPEVAKMSDTELFDLTKKGKEKMPAYDKKLTDDQIKQLVKYIRELK